MGKSMNDIHLWKNLRLGLWISQNLSLADFLEIASLNSTLLKKFIAVDLGKQELEKYRSSLKRETSQPNGFLKRRNFTNDFLFFSTVSKVARNSRLRDANLGEAHRRVSPTDGPEDGGKLLIQMNPLKQVHIIDTSVKKLSMTEGLVLLHLLSGADGDVLTVRSLRNVIVCKITARPHGSMWRYHEGWRPQWVMRSIVTRAWTRTSAGHARWERSLHSTQQLLHISHHLQQQHTTWST
jgi:hypothetical protein